MYMYICICIHVYTYLSIIVNTSSSTMLDYSISKSSRQITSKLKIEASAY